MANSILIAGDRLAIWAVGTAIIAAFTIKGVSSYFQSVLMLSIGASVTARLQREQFQKLIRLGMPLFAGKHPNGVVSGVLYSARAAKNALILVLTNLIRDVATVIGLLGVMIFQDPTLSAFAFIFSPFAVFAVARIMRRVKNLSKTEADLFAGLNVVALEALQGLRIVKSFNLEDEMDNRIGHAIDRMEERQNALARAMSLSSPFFDILAGLIIGCFVFYAGSNTVDQVRTPGEYMAFITAFLLAYDPMKRIANLNVQLQKEMVGIKRLFRVLDDDEAENFVPKSSATVEFPRNLQRLSFDNVRFSYTSGNAPALNGLSFDVGLGKKLALVGRSGSGKSTVLNLIMGMYSPTAGSISVNGVPISNLELKSLRAKIAFVAQDTFLFSGTIRDNVAFGKPDCIEQDIHEALKQADAYEFVMALPEGLDTVATNGGAEFSGGQRQRLAIARAFLKSAPILLLDEATSALDGQTERNIREALKRLSAGRLTIIVAHRLSTIQDADEVLVLDAGKIVARGNHADLQKDANYQRLFSMKEIV
jgi:ATP-binding cassette, subfamily B, bacterial MsbA